MAENLFHVEVRTQYLPHQSSPHQNIYRFGYTVRITNQGGQAGQLIARHWWIEDALGHTEEVRGLGVVGEQPTLEPGESYEYSSGCQLHTATGAMRGHYLCVTDQGDVFHSPVPEFELAAYEMPNVPDISNAPSGPRVLH